MSDKTQRCVHFAVSFKYSTYFFKVTTEELGVVMQRGKRSPFLQKCNDPLEVTNSFGICRYSSLGKYSCLEAEIRLMGILKEETGLFICCRSVSMHSPLCCLFIYYYCLFVCFICLVHALLQLSYFLCVCLHCFTNASLGLPIADCVHLFLATPLITCQHKC